MKNNPSTISLSRLLAHCTIGIPVYNRLDYLSSALQSIEKYVSLGLRVIVVDDGSRTEVRELLIKMVPANIQLFHNEKNLGLFGNWNRCLQLAERPFFGILCSDDAIEPGYLEGALSLLERNPSVALVNTKGLTISPSGKPLGQIAGFFPQGVYDGKAAAGCFIDFYANTGHNPFNYPSGVLIRTDIAEKVGGFDTTMRHTGDIEFFYRMLNAGDLGIIEETGCSVTIHSAQAGSILANELIGMRELSKIVEDQPNEVLPKKVKQTLHQQHFSLALWHAWRFWCQRRHKTALEYLRYAQENSKNYFQLFLGIVRLLLGKIQVKISPLEHKWARQLNYHRRDIQDPTSADSR